MADYQPMQYEDPNAWYDPEVYKSEQARLADALRRSRGFQQMGAGLAFDQDTQFTPGGMGAPRIAVRPDRTSQNLASLMATGGGAYREAQATKGLEESQKGQEAASEKAWKRMMQQRYPQQYGGGQSVAGGQGINLLGSGGINSLMGGAGGGGGGGSVFPQTMSAKSQSPKALGAYPEEELVASSDEGYVPESLIEPEDDVHEVVQEEVPYAEEFADRTYTDANDEDLQDLPPDLDPLRSQIEQNEQGSAYDYPDSEGNVDVTNTGAHPEAKTLPPVDVEGTRAGAEEPAETPTDQIQTAQTSLAQQPQTQDNTWWELEMMRQFPSTREAMTRAYNEQIEARKPQKILSMGGGVVYDPNTNRAYMLPEYRRSKEEDALIKTKLSELNHGFRIAEELNREAGRQTSREARFELQARANAQMDENNKIKLEIANIAAGASRERSRAQVASSRAGGGAAFKVPSDIRKGFVTGQKKLATINRAIDLLQQNPDSVGIIKGNAPQWMLNIADPAGVEARSMLANVGTAELLYRSGAAVTVGEYERTRPFIPAQNEPYQMTLWKLQQLKNIAEDEMRIYETHYMSGGVLPPGMPAYGTKPGATGPGAGGGTPGAGWKVEKVNPAAPPAAAAPPPPPAAQPPGAGWKIEKVR